MKISKEYYILGTISLITSYLLFGSDYFAGISFFYNIFIFLLLPSAFLLLSLISFLKVFRNLKKGFKTKVLISLFVGIVFGFLFYALYSLIRQLQVPIWEFNQ